jgi:hypothetical protein
MFKLPPLLASFFSLFPLHTYPSIPPLNKLAVSLPTLWIHPPRDSSTPSDTNLLSEDVECLKWQAYLALRGLTNIKIRSDVKAEGGIDRRLPTLHLPTSESLEKSEVLNISECSENGQLLPTNLIPTWVDMKLGVNFNADLLEGYKDEAARDESRAWVALLEGVVHAALVCACLFFMQFTINSRRSYSSRHHRPFDCSYSLQTRFHPTRSSLPSFSLHRHPLLAFPHFCRPLGRALQGPASFHNTATPPLPYPNV